MVGRGLVIGGVVTMCVSMVAGPFLVIAPAGVVMVLVGGALLGRRALGVALLGLGVVSGLCFYPVGFALHDEGARPGVFGSVVWGGVAVVAVVGIIGGLILLIWPRRGK
jgi:hypothetical protein